MSYIQDIFYHTGHLSINEKIKLCKDAKELCYHWHVDILDCSISPCRQEIDMEFEEILDKLEHTSHFVFIHRRGFIKDKDKIGDKRDLFTQNEWCLEIGFSTMQTGPSYYLWINCEQDYIEDLANKFNLTQNE